MTLDTEDFAQSTFYTETLLNRSSCTETLLQTEEFAQSIFNTTTLLHTEAFTQRAVFTKPISREMEGCTGQAFYRCFWRCACSSCRKGAETSHTLDDGHARSLRILPNFLSIRKRSARDGCVSKASVPPAPVALIEDLERLVTCKCLKVFSHSCLHWYLCTPVSYTPVFRGCFQRVVDTCLV